MADVQYRAELDDRQVLAALKNIDRNMDKLAGQGNKSFTQVGKGATASGIQIGAVSGIVQELTRRFIQMAEQAARAFVNVIAGGVDLNKQLELTEIALTNILGGNQEAAEAFLDTTRDTARRLRTDYVELAQLAATILPQANDIEATNQLLEQAIILGKAAGQSATGIRIALQEALAGQFISLQRRLNIPGTAIDRIRKLSEEIGLVPALVEVLSDRVQELGIDLDSTAATAAAAFATLEAEGKRFQQVMGEPVLEELKEQANAFLDILETKGTSIENAAIAFGELAAAVVELIGSNLQAFLEELDFEQLEQTADALNEMVDALGLFLDVAGLIGDTSDDIEGMRGIVQSISDALVTAAKAAALLKASLDALPGVNLEFLLTGNPAALIRDVNEAQAEGKTAQERYQDSLLESAKAFDTFNKKLEENEENTRQRHAEVEKDTQASLDAAQAYLQQEQRLKELAEAEAKAAEAQKKIGEELEESTRERGQRLNEISIDAERQRTEDAVEAAQKREDIARKNAQEIEDILRKHGDEIEDAARDLSRDEADIARKAARERGEIERDAANERVNVETEFRREMERIRDRFAESAAEAERNNDAQAFLEAMRQRDRDIGDARRTRDESLEDAKTRAVEQRAALQEQLAYELEDARIANQRKLEDLQLRLQRELEEQAIQNEREVEEQALKEARLREQRAVEYQQELEDFTRKEFQKLQELGRSLEKEVASIQTAERLKREVRVAEAQATVDQVNAAFARLNPFGTSTPSRGQYYYRGAAQRQAGGEAEAGKPYIIGEKGPEIFIPQTHGTIVPNAMIGGGMTDISNAYDYSRRMDVGGVNIGQDMLNNPAAVRRLHNIVLGILSEAL